jgi:hypothetical protein
MTVTTPAVTVLTAALPAAIAWVTVESSAGRRFLIQPAATQQPVAEEKRSEFTELTEVTR